MPVHPSLCRVSGKAGGGGLWQAHSYPSQLLRGETFIHSFILDSSRLSLVGDGHPGVSCRASETQTPRSTPGGVQAPPGSGGRVGTVQKEAGPVAASV